MKDSATNCLNGRAAPTHRRSGAPAAVSRTAFDLRDGRRVIVGSSLGGGVDDCGERRRTCMEGEAVCSRLRLRGCPSLLAQGQRRGSPCRSLQCRDLLPAPRLGRFCRNSVSCNGCLPEIGLASRCFSANYLANSRFCKGRGQVGLPLNHQRPDVAFESCRPELGRSADRAQDGARILFADNPEPSLSAAQLEAGFGHSGCVEERVQKDRGDR
jgi:hypothetical protein